MFKIKSAILFLFLTVSFLGFSQGQPKGKKVKISGKVLEKSTGLPLEYTTITLKDVNDPKDVTGGITNPKGDFDFAVNTGTYDITIEFLSFKKIEIKQKSIQSNTNLGTFSLIDDSTQLNEVTIKAERPMVEMKLDKRVYNVGNDLMSKGGTVSDILDNVPSVTVDSDGTVSVRGNSDVRILVDGRPVTATNVNDALKQIPADAVDKIEVVTNPSARYDAEGGGGVLNIILKKGKNQGVNGSVTANGGLSANQNKNLMPSNQALTANVNYKTKKVNWFTTIGYFDRNNPGNSTVNTQYLNADGTTNSHINQYSYNEKKSEGANINLGADWDVTKSLTWGNSVNIRNSHGGNPQTVTYNYFDAGNNPTSTSYRVNEQYNKSENLDYNTNLTKKFKKEGHKLTINGTFAKTHEIAPTTIFSQDQNFATTKTESTQNIQDIKRAMAQADYVLPFGKAGQFEAGYKGDFNSNVSAYTAGQVVGGAYQPYAQFTNTLQYLERINALYTQVGAKVNKFSYLFGLRYENSSIDINQLATSEFHKKRYANLFPSAFFTYEVNTGTSISLSYSKRISRPRGMQINPFSNYSSNINFFKGNPDLNPAYTDAYNLGLIKTWPKVMLNSSIYLNRTAGDVTFVKTQQGTSADGIPITVTTPINLATEYRSGFEFNLNYSPWKVWKLTSNLNIFRNQTYGKYEYTNSNNVLVVQNFDYNAYSWRARATSKVTLPGKVDWQTNLNYKAPQNNAQGTSIGIFYTDLAFSKDVLKDKGTIAFNVQDLFNSNKRIFETHLPELNSYTSMQYRVRQFNLSFTYRFNKKKTEKEKPAKNPNQDQPDDMGY